MGNRAAKARNAPQDTDPTVEVLYQKMGDRWFAFSMIDDEVFVGSLTQEEIDRAEQAARARPQRGNA